MQAQCLKAKDIPKAESAVALKNWMMLDFWSLINYFTGKRG